MLYTFLNYSLIGTLVIYCKTSTIIQNKYNYYYNNNPSFKSCINHLCHFYRCVVAFVNNHKVEPFNDSWLNVVVLLDDHTYDKVISYIETYDCLDSNDNVFDKVIQNCNNMIDLGSNILEYLIIAKYENKYYYYVKKPREIFLDNEISNVTFLCISYNHPNMKQPIFIELKKSEMVEKNEILSAAFIKRILDYQPEKYVFDMNYTLKIIDNNVNELVLNSKQYIVLNETNYCVITRS